MRVGAYLYNAFEQRVQKVASSTTTQQVYDRFGHLLEDANASGVVQKEYIWLDDLPVAMVDDTGASPVVYFIHTDQLGTPQKITDASANVVWDSVSDPFGNAVTISSLWGSPTLWGSFTWEPTTPVPTNLRFPGQYADTETALNQNWFRDYDPTVGRYIQSDPIGLNGGIDTYVYSGGNPFKQTDPMGMGWWDWLWGKKPPPPQPPSDICPSDRLHNCTVAYLFCLFDGAAKHIPEEMCHAAMDTCVKKPNVPMIFPPGQYIPPGKLP